ncbi:MAG TPA: adaptor protein MecA [Candidatus Eisenbergiella stercorigallinarum]|uniref:Adaptor protein MecA n=1 Tax=Candidatus Eisenbergiella stercorigallinarum TaxID=2838557 RepID=A0A9D2R2M2_9FIRM|nr:adaptor protein MecA [Candidatus Eisenbergiella stercorigallinarum]
MKIEKVNDHQIRCTLTRADLADRELKISELAYGTEKAKSLFRDMMQQAAVKFGFEAEDIPLMIEAIPLNSDCIVLIITKVEDPEELDTRFSKFAPSVHDDDSLDDMIQELNEGADDVLDLFRRIHEGRAASQAGTKEAQKPSSDTDADKKGKEENLRISRVFSFDSLRHITRLAHILEGSYGGSNSLYKDAARGRYLLTVSSLGHTAEEFGRLCNCLSEYGKQERYTPGGEAFWAEHCELIVKDRALQVLSRI